MQKSEYAYLMSNVEKLNEMKDELTNSLKDELKYPFYPTYFTEVEGVLKIFKLYPGLANLDDFNEIQNAVRISKTGRGMFKSPDFKRAGEIICSNSVMLIQEAEKLAESKKTPKDPKLKEPMIQLLQKFEILKSELYNTYGQGFNRLDARNEWVRKFQKHRTDILGLLETFFAWDPDLEYAPGVGYARVFLKLPSIKSYDSEDKINEKYAGTISGLSSAAKNMEFFSGNVKAEYGIQEEEVKNYSRIKQLEGELAYTTNQLKGIVEQVVASKKGRTSPAAGYREIDISTVKNLINELSSTVMNSIFITDGKIDMRFTPADLEGKVNVLKEELRFSQYEPSFDDIVFLAKILHLYRNEPDKLNQYCLELRDNINDLKMEIDKYEIRVKRKEALSQL